MGTNVLKHNCPILLVAVKETNQVSKTSEINKVTSYGEILCSEVYNLEFKIPSSHIKKAKRNRWNKCQ